MATRFEQDFQKAHLCGMCMMSQPRVFGNDRPGAVTGYCYRSGCYAFDARRANDDYRECGFAGCQRVVPASKPAETCCSTCVNLKAAMRKRQRTDLDYLLNS